MNLSLKNRIAFFYLSATAVLTALLFILIYFVVHNTVYSHLDEDLESLRDEVENNLFIDKNSIIFANAFEWKEWQHGRVEVNPSFIQVVDNEGKIIKKTDNLINDSLEFDPLLPDRSFYDSKLSNNSIRQVQSPLLNPEGKSIGYLIIAIPLDETSLVLKNLRIVLISGFPIVLIFLFLITRWIAGKSTVPIKRVISTAAHITKENLTERIELPLHKDEIYTLTSTINGLLERLQDAVLREKQFTADASHELRTPLSILKGTLEVLVRKPRDIKQYESKISYCINEVDRMSKIIDQLLILARYESGKIQPQSREIELNESIQYVLLRMQEIINRNCIRINFKADKKYLVKADPSMLDVILENLISNAIKYSNGSKDIEIDIESLTGSIICKIKDYGVGISEDQLTKIFDRFYRVDRSRTSQIEGHGLGLAIVKRLADLQKINILFKSEISKGTTAIISFPV